MDGTKKRKIRAERHARRLATMAYREAGASLTEIARARHVAPGTPGHWTLDRPDPAILRPLLDLILGDGTDALALVEAVNDAYEMHAIVLMDDAPLIEDGLRLMDIEPVADGEEDAPDTRATPIKAARLERVARISWRLAMVMRELLERGIDLQAVYDDRQAAA